MNHVRILICWLLLQTFSVVRTADLGTQIYQNIKHWIMPNSSEHQSSTIVDDESSGLVRNIENNTPAKIIVKKDDQGRMVVYQPYDLDHKIILKYYLLPTVYKKSHYRFPQDFMVEIPNVLLQQHDNKNLHDLVMLGTHNSFANPVDGFLYYQQQDSMKDQFEHGGVRMLRPAWHNPSGSFLEQPNTEPILCHSDDHTCATVSLVSRGFRPHKKVLVFNTLLFEMLQRYRNDVVIVGLNNYLNSDKTDREIEKVAGLAEMIITPQDLQSEYNHEEWHGLWPSMAWMRKHNKRVLFLNNQETKYTISYDQYVMRNMYGRQNIEKASQMRDVNRLVKRKSNAANLVELSWFQNVSLPLHEQEILAKGASLYTSFLALIPAMFAKALIVPEHMFSFVAKIHNNIASPLQNFIAFLRIVEYQARYLLSLGFTKSLIENVKKNHATLKKIITSIEKYIPLQQDNSLAVLQKLVRSCRASGVISERQVPNIIMLDFATTTGDGLSFVNLLNMLVDKKRGIQFVDVGGFAYQGVLLSVDDLV